MEGYRSSTSTLAFWSILICAYFLAIESAYIANKKSKLVLNIVSVSNCSEDQQLPTYVRNVNVKRLTRESMVVNGDLVVTSKQPNVKFEAMIYKCNNRMGTECEEYLRVPFADACFLLTAKNQFWSPVLESFHPRFKCPIEVGVYTLTNGTFDIGKLMDVASTIPHITANYWRHTLRFYNNKESVFCATYVGSLQQIRN